MQGRGQKRGASSEIMPSSNDTHVKRLSDRSSWMDGQCQSPGMTSFQGSLQVPFARGGKRSNCYPRVCPILGGDRLTLFPVHLTSDTFQVPGLFHTPSHSVTPEAPGAFLAPPLPHTHLPSCPRGTYISSSSFYLSSPSISAS